MLQDSQHLIHMGERGAKLYLIRKGQICVMKPAEQAGGRAVELAVLGRGHFVGERTLVTGPALPCSPGDAKEGLPHSIHSDLGGSRF